MSTLSDASSPNSALSPELRADLAERYSIGPEFLSLYKGLSACGDLTGVHSADNLGKGDLSRMYIHFALSTVVRGRGVRDLIISSANRIPPLTGARYLDVGTAYGGFLVAFAEIGYEPVGVELDPYWASLGNANCRDHGLPDCVIEADFLKLDIDALGKFDVITCNDVIEHVLDPVEAISRISLLLKPGGVAFFEIPNRRCVHFVAKDGHYGLFGICLLEHFEAEMFFREATGNPGYNCGEMYRTEWYLNTLRRFGLDADVIRNHQSTKFDEAPRDMLTLSNAFAWWDREERQRHSALMVDTVRRKYAHYQHQVFGDYYAAFVSGDFAAFERDYLSRFWSVLARSAGGGPSRM